MKKLLSFCYFALLILVLNCQTINLYDNFGFTGGTLNSSQVAVSTNHNVLFAESSIFFVGANDRKIYKISWGTNGWEGGESPLVSNQDLVLSNSEIIYANGHIYFIGDDNKIYDIVNTNGTWSGGTWPLRNEQDPVQSGTKIVFNNSHIYFVGTDRKVYDLVWNGSAWTGGTWPLNNNQQLLHENSDIYVPNNGKIFFIDIYGEVNLIEYISGIGWTGGTFPLGGWHTAVLSPEYHLEFSSENHVYYIGTDNKIHDIVKENNVWSTGTPKSNQVTVKSGTELHYANSHVYYIGSNSKIYDLYWNSGWYGGITPLHNDAIAGTNSKLYSEDSHLFFKDLDSRLSYLVWDEICVGSGDCNYPNFDTDCDNCSTDITCTDSWHLGVLPTSKTIINSTNTNILSNLDMHIYYVGNDNKIHDALRHVHNPNTKTGYTLVFEDEFDESSLDTETWTTHFPWGSGYNECLSYHDGTNNMDFTSNTLQISVEDDPGYYNYWTTWPVQNYSRYYDYTSGMISTGGDTRDYAYSGPDTSFDYGYYEIRCKVARGKRVWNAFWLASHISWPPEIDILEVEGDGRHLLCSNVYKTTDGNKSIHQRETAIGYRYYEDFYTYGLEWDEDYLRYYLNNELVAEYDINDLPSGQTMFSGHSFIPTSSFPMYLIASINYQNHLAICENENFPNVKYEIDYIRVYKKNLLPIRRNAADVTSNSIVSEKSVTLFPNPANDFITVKANSDMNIQSITVCNIYGQHINVLTCNSNEFILKTETWQSGVYFLLINIDGVIIKEKVIIL